MNNTYKLIQLTDVEQYCIWLVKLEVKYATLTYTNNIKNRIDKEYPCKD